MTTQEAIRILGEESCKRCKDYNKRANECLGSVFCFDAKRCALDALYKVAFLDQCDSMRKAVSDAQDTMP